jgi:hypothetical protein
MDQQYTLRLEKIEAELNRLLPETPGLAWQAEVFPGMSSQNVTHLLPALTAPGRDLLSRGGKPAVHIIHGVDTAINGGCFLFY